MCGNFRAANFTHIHNIKPLQYTTQLRNVCLKYTYSLLTNSRCYTEHKQKDLLHFYNVSNSAHINYAFLFTNDIYVQKMAQSQNSLSRQNIKQSGEMACNK